MKQPSGFALTVLLLIGQHCLCQPVLNSKEVINGVYVYQDFKDPAVLYYNASTLELSKSSAGKPDFNIRSYRYEGNGYLGDKNKYRFVNYVYLSLEMRPIEKSLLNDIKREKGIDILLKPLPIQHIEVDLLIPVKKDKEFYEAEAFPENGKESQNRIWTKRNYRIRLDDYAAQLLMHQIQSEQLAISIGYTLFSPVVRGKSSDLGVIGNTDAHKAKQFQQLSLDDISDTTQIIFPIISNAFPVEIDLQKWSDLVEKKDVTITTGYPHVEVRCYDFKYRLRPELDRKEVELRTLSVTGKFEIQVVEFNRNNPLNVTQILSFKKPIDLTRPLEYRFREYAARTVKQTAWKKHASWTDIINISTPVESLPFQKKLLKLETDPALFEKVKLDYLEITLDYQLHEKRTKKKVVLTTKNWRKEVEFHLDKSTMIRYWIKWKYANGEKKYTSKNTLKGNYLFINTPPL